MWETIDKLENEVALNTCEGKCQTETVKKTLKSLSKSQWYIINVRFFNLHTSLLKMHSSDILNLEEKVKKELMSVNTVYQ